MSRTVIVTVLCLLASLAHAKMYKCKDADGNIIYTDEPCVGGEEMKLPPLPTFKLPPKSSDSKKTTRDVPKAGKTVYKNVEILKPKHDSQIQNNTGDVQIIVDVTPGLDQKQGHKLSLTLDGKKLEGEGTSPRILLSNVDPGSHSIQVSVVNKAGVVLKSSEPVTIHMRKNTVYQPGQGDSQRAVGSTPATRAPGL